METLAAEVVAAAAECKCLRGMFGLQADAAEDQLSCWGLRTSPGSDLTATALLSTQAHLVEDVTPSWPFDAHKQGVQSIALPKAKGAAGECGDSRLAV